MSTASGGLLSAEHAAALQAVTLDMHFVPRGVPGTDPQVGSFLGAVGEHDYTSSVEILGSIDPARGDMLAAEQLGFRNAVAQLTPFFQKVGLHLAGSQLRNPKLPHDAHRPLLEDARYTRSVDAVDYGIGYALLHNLPVRFADFSGEQLEDVAAQLGMRTAKEAQQHPEFVTLRSAAILSRLGDIALVMAGSGPIEGGRAPVLKSLHGIDLAAPLSRLLHAHDVFPSVTRHTDVHGISAMGRFVYNRLHPSASGKQYQTELMRLQTIAQKQADAKKAADEAALIALEERREQSKQSLNN